jgi:hypothetical protein
LQKKQKNARIWTRQKQGLGRRELMNERYWRAVNRNLLILTLILGGGLILALWQPVAAGIEFLLTN